MHITDAHRTKRLVAEIKIPVYNVNIMMRKKEKNMTVLYEVITGHTKQVLKAYAKLYTEEKNKALSFRFWILAAIFFTLPRTLDADKSGYLICYAFGIFVIILALFRQYLTYFNLMVRDKYYKEKTRIEMSFGHSKFVVNDGQEKVYKYNEVTQLYADYRHYFLHLHDSDLLILPKKDFASGNANEFYTFMQNSTGKEFKAVNLNLKDKIFKLKWEMKKAEIEHDKKIKNK